MKEAGGKKIRKTKKPKDEASANPSTGACSSCGQPLVELLWSKSDGQCIYILTCDNTDCAWYRNPVKTIVKEV